jgi:hypothetical protein
MGRLPSEWRQLLKLVNCEHTSQRLPECAELIGTDGADVGVGWVAIYDAREYGARVARIGRSCRLETVLGYRFRQQNRKGHTPP